MRRALVIGVAVCGVGVLFACGKFLEAPGSGQGVDGSAADGPVVDGAVANADGSTEPFEPFVVVTTDAAAPLVPQACPLADCPSEVQTCKDEDCDDAERDFFPVGTLVVDGGACTLSTGGPAAFSYRTLPRPAARSYTVLAVKIIDMTPGDRVVATLSIEGAPANGERIVLRRRNGAFELCERNANGTRCTAPLGVAFPQTLQVFGTVTSEDPPNATFALGTLSDECRPLRVLDLTKPFEAGEVRGEIGCLGVGGQCSFQFDDGLLLMKAE